MHFWSLERFVAPPSEANIFDRDLDVGVSLFRAGADRTMSTPQQLFAEGVRQLAIPLSLAAILNISFSIDLPEYISNQISGVTTSGKLVVALVSAGACCTCILWRRHQEWAEIDRISRAAQRAKVFSRQKRGALDVESLAAKRQRLQEALWQAEEDADRARLDNVAPAVGSCKAGVVHVRMGRSTDAADKSLVTEIVAMINQSYRHGYADILVTEHDSDTDVNDDQHEAHAKFTRTSFDEIVSRLQMCSDSRSARKLLLAFDSRQNCLGCCSVTAPYGEPRLGEWGLVCVAMRAQGRGIGSRLVAAAEAHCVLRGCDILQLEFFTTEEHRYSTRLRTWYYDKLGYRQVHRQQCGNQLRGYATSVPMYFEVGHKRVSEKTVDTTMQRKLNLLALTQEIANRRSELRKLNELATLPTLSLSNLPEEIVVQLLLPLCGPRELRALAMSCTHLRDALQDASKDEIQRCWYQICHSTTNAGAPMLCYNATQLLGPAESFGLSQPSVSIDWKLVYRLRHSLPCSVSIVADVGKGYTRYGLTQSGPEIFPIHALSSQGVVEKESLSHPPSPRILQLCSSPSHPPDASVDDQISQLLQRITPEYRRLTALKAIAAGDDGRSSTAAAVQGWPWPSVPALEHIASEIPLLVGEPFWLLKRYPGRGRTEAEKRINVKILEEWRVKTEQQCCDSCCVRFVPQPYMAMAAHGVSADGDALILNLGMRECIACAVVGGVLIDSSVQETPLGGSGLTMLFLQHLANNPANTSWLRNDDMTWCRDQKEKHCFVRLPSEDMPAPVEVPRPRAEALSHGTCLLDDERWLVPEALFDPHRYGMDVSSITALLVAALSAAVNEASHSTTHDMGGTRSSSSDCSLAYRQMDVIERLLGSIVVVGGASGIPNLRRRIEVDLGVALKTSDLMASLMKVSAGQPGHADRTSVGHDRLRPQVLLPVFGGTHPMAGNTIFHGGCVLASSALGMERSLGSTKSGPGQTHSDTHRSIGGGLAPWLTRVCMTPHFREQCLTTVALARAGQAEPDDECIGE